MGQPDVLVLDEPTSGLDPGYEKAVMTSLRELADAGRTVIAVTHSMQALEQCDRVLFLAEGGRVAYFGPPARAAAYFGRGDAADVFLALDTESGQAWKERFRAHPAYAKYVEPGRSRRHPRAPAAAWSHSRPSARPGRRSSASCCGARWPCSAPTGATWPSSLLQGPILGLLIWLVVQSDSLRTHPALPGGTATVGRDRGHVRGHERHVARCLQRRARRSSRSATSCVARSTPGCSRAPTWPPRPSCSGW